MTIIEQLKQFAEVEFKNLPASYDFDSLTAIEQSELLRRKLENVIAECNKFVELTTSAFNELAIETDCDMNKYVLHLESICRKYTDLIDEKIRRQNNTLDKLFVQFNQEVYQTIESYFNNMMEIGEFDEAIISAINDSNTELRKMQAFYYQQADLYARAMRSFDAVKEEVQSYHSDVRMYLGQHAKVTGTIDLVNGYGVEYYEVGGNWDIDNCMVIGVNLSSDNAIWSPLDAFKVNNRMMNCSVKLDSVNNRITIVVDDPDEIYTGTLHYRLLLFKQ